MQLSANIAGFVIDSSSSFASTVKKSQTYEDICSISLKENIPALYPKDIKDPGFLSELEKLNADIFIVCGFQYFFNKIQKLLQLYLIINNLTINA